VTSLLDETVPGGAAWSAVVTRQRVVRLQAETAGANVSLLLFAAHRPWERLCVPDTLKAQMSACVRPPMVLMSDAGKALVSMTGSSLRWHDALTGHSTQDQVDARFGRSSYAGDGNGWRRSARTGLLCELAKHGLGERDLHATVNVFSMVVPAGDELGSLAFVEAHAAAGDWVELRTEDDVLIVLSTAPHPLDPAEHWSPSGVRVTVRTAPPPQPDDPTRLFREEAARALEAVGRHAL
jgi:urea carboxylase-associated protein 2